MISRRAFIGGLAGGLLAAPLAAAAQGAGKVYRVGLVFTTAPVSEMVGPNPVHPLVRSFLDELRVLGYVQGRNLVFEARSAEGKFERFKEILEGLVSLKMDVIVTNGNSMTQRAKELTSVIPIVMIFVNDPVADRLVASLARPGGNVTGVWPRSDEVDQGGEKTLGVFDERMVNFNVLRQRSPHSWPPSP